MDFNKAGKYKDSQVKCKEQVACQYAVSLQAITVLNPALDSHYILSGLQLPFHKQTITAKLQ